MATFKNMSFADIKLRRPPRVWDDEQGFIRQERTPERIAEFKELCERMVSYWRRRTRSKRPSKDGADLLIPGWRVLGDGLFSVVFVHEAFPDLVLKISGRAGFACTSLCGWQAEVMDGMDAWPVFARHCMAHHAANLPEVLHFQQISPSLSWGILPRYEGCKTDVATSKCGYPVEVFQTRVKSWLKGIHPAPEWFWPIKTMADALGMEADVHLGNIMFDPVNNQYILTDPFSFRDKQSSQARLSVDDDPDSGFLCG